MSLPRPGPIVPPAAPAVAVDPEKRPLAQLRRLPSVRGKGVVLTVAALLAATLTGLVPQAPATAAPNGRGSDAAVPTATVAPIPAALGKGIQGRVSPTAVDLPALGYSEEEFSVSGTATSYTADGSLNSDGKWKVKPTGQAPYKTRMVVRRPTDPAKFNGTVIVEWVNVSFGVDIPVEFGQSWEEITREGYAYVGISAQKVGIDKVKSFDPVRYPDLTTPGDTASYDIFSQAAKAARAELGGRRLIASGHSQSALRMVTYANAIQPRDNVFDGFLIHGRATGSAGIAPGAGTPLVSNIRPDLGVPTLQVQAETDTLLYSLSRQPDADHVRTWEVAGTAHGDAYLTSQLDKVNAREKVIDNGNPVRCDKPLNSMPAHYAHNAAYHALDQWIRTGTPARKAPLIEGFLVLLSRDANGNVKGGIRLPDIEVPIASYAPTNSGGNVPGACLLLGTTTPFDAAKLKSLYPTHQDYVAKYTAAAAKARDAGFLRPADYTAAIAAAQARNIPPA
jgi:hypothetical protein